MMMGKMKEATCPACGKTIGRHDPNRMKVQVARGTLHRVVKSRGGISKEVFSGVHKDYHLACVQAMQ